MENGGFIKSNVQKTNFIQLPNFRLNENKENNFNINKDNRLFQSQTLASKNKENSLTISISDKIREMKAELSRENGSKQQRNNNDFRMRLERISKGKFEPKKNVNDKKFLLNRDKKGIDLNLMKNKLKNFETQREQEKMQKNNAFDELDDIFNNFRNNRYGN